MMIIIRMKYLLSTNLKYIPELGGPYKKQKNKKARTVQTITRRRWLSVAVI